MGIHRNPSVIVMGFEFSSVINFEQHLPAKAVFSHGAVANISWEKLTTASKASRRGRVISGVVVDAVGGVALLL